MAVTVTLPNDLEQFLQTHAGRVGVSLETLLSRTIIERWDGASRAPGLGTRETELLLKLQTLFPAEQTREYQALCQKSDAGTLTDADRPRLIALVEQRDLQNAERLEVLAELAGLRGVSLRDVMAELGIGPN